MCVIEQYLDQSRGTARISALTRDCRRVTARGTCDSVVIQTNQNGDNASEVGYHPPSSILLLKAVRGLTWHCAQRGAALRQHVTRDPPGDVLPECPPTRGVLVQFQCNRLGSAGRSRVKLLNTNKSFGRRR